MTTKILIVDDESDIRQLIGLSFKETLPSAQIFEAKDGTEALKMIQAHSFDLMTSDLKMPKMDGETLLNSLKDSDKKSRPKQILVLSGHMDGTEEMRFPKLGLTFLAKPFDPLQLESWIKESIFQINTPQIHAPSTNWADVPGPTLDLDLSKYLVYKSESSNPNPLVVEQFSKSLVGVIESLTSQKIKLVSKTGLSQCGYFGGVCAYIPFQGKNNRGLLSMSFTQKGMTSLFNQIVGEDFKELTPEIMDTAHELCNQVFARSKKTLNELGYGLPKVVPTLCGANVQPNIYSGQCLSLVYESPWGEILLQVGFD